MKISVTSNTVLQDVERLTITATRQEKLDIDLAISVQGVGKALLDLENSQHVAESLSGFIVNGIAEFYFYKNTSKSVTVKIIKSMDKYFKKTKVLNSINSPQRVYT